MKTTKATATITLMIAVALAMAACTPTAPTDPTTSPTSSPTATPTPTPTPGAVATPSPAPVPTNQQEAITSAATTIESYLVASFDRDANPELGESYVGSFLVQGSQAAKLNADTVKNNLEKGWLKVGTPSTWTTNDAMSYASPSTNAATGETLDFGTAVVYGCSDNSTWDITVPAGQEAPAIPKGAFPAQWTLIFEQNAQVWLIQEQVDLTGREGAPTC